MTLTEDRLAELLKPYLPGTVHPPNLYSQLSTYLDLLLRWNARTNLTAIRDPEEIVQRHFGESLFTGIHLAPHLPPAATILDFGSGAGFPGLPIQLLRPDFQVTLSESQGKKATFLREVIRSLDLKTGVWAGRVEAMPLSRRFHAVTLRAVDRMDEALSEAEKRLSPGGTMAAIGGKDLGVGTESASHVAIPNSVGNFVYFRQL